MSDEQVTETTLYDELLYVLEGYRDHFEAAKELGVSRSTIDRIVTIDGYKASKRTRQLIHDAYMEECANAAWDYDYGSYW